MRTTFDRIRHAVSFELIALILVTLVGGPLFGVPIEHMGVVALVSATIATGWNYVYNILFDHALLRRRGTVLKTPVIRVLHAILFEAGMLVGLLPFIAWYLGISLVAAFVMDVSFTIFYLLYAFAFNWAYDLVFPPPAARNA